jgi:perosamine synthetase
MPKAGKKRARSKAGKADKPIVFARPYFGAAEERAVAATVRRGWVVGGPQLAEFERRFAEYCGVRYAVGVSSWTAGAFLVLHAWGIGPGDEVIVPALTFIASINVIRHAGATPIFAEIDPRTYNIDPADVARKITARTKVLLPIDQIGLPCDIDAINDLAQKHGLRVLDDAACAFASRNRRRQVGSLADVTVFSLHARKVVTTGEGGMITTNDGAFADRLRMLRHQGMSLSDHARQGLRPTVFEVYPEIGYNFRITDLQAAVGLAQLDRLESMLLRRREIAERYNGALADHPVLAPPFVPEGLEPNWQSYQVSIRPGARLGQKQVMDRLFDLGVPTRRGVMASHLEPPYRGQASLPITEAVAASTVQLPMHAGLTREQQEHIIAALRELSL